MRRIGFWIEIHGSSYKVLEGIVRVLTKAISEQGSADQIYFVCADDCEDPIRRSLADWRNRKNLFFITTPRYNFVEKCRNEVISFLGKLEKPGKRIRSVYVKEGALRGPLVQFKQSGALGFVLILILNVTAIILERVSSKMKNVLLRFKFKRWQDKLVQKVNQSNLDRVVVANPVWSGWYGINKETTTLFWDVFSIDDPSFIEVARAEGNIARTLELTNKGVAMSEHTKTNLLKLVASSDQKVKVSPPPVFSSIEITQSDAVAHVKQLLVRKFHETRNPYLPDLPLTEMPFVLCATQNRKNKNLISLINSFEILIRRYRSNLKLVLTTPAERELLDLVVKRGLVFDVIFLSELSEVELSSLFSLCKLVVIPSTFEGGIPLNLVEAAKRGKPVVVAQMPTVKTAKNFDEVSKYTFYPTDTRDMASKMLMAIREVESNVKVFSNFVTANAIHSDWNSYYNDISR